MRKRHDSRAREPEGMVTRAGHTLQVSEVCLQDAVPPGSIRRAGDRIVEVSTHSQETRLQALGGGLDRLSDCACQVEACENK